METRSPNGKGGDREGKCAEKRGERPLKQPCMGTLSFPKLILVTQEYLAMLLMDTGRPVEGLKLHVLESSRQLLKDNHASFQTEMKEDQCPLSFLWATSALTLAYFICPLHLVRKQTED